MILAVGCARDADTSVAPEPEEERVKAPTSAKPPKPIAPKPLDGEPVHSLICDKDEVHILAGLNLPKPVDYIATEQVKRKGFNLIEHGTRCGAGQGAVCEARFKAQRTPTAGLFMSCIPEGCTTFLVYRRGAAVGRITSHTELKKFLGPIDTANEALLWAWAHQHHYGSCDKLRASDLRVAGTKYFLASTRRTSDCPVIRKRFISEIHRDGTIKEIESQVIERSKACI